MKLEDTTVTIEPRSVGACLDLAFVFYRCHARSLLFLTLLFALPAVALSAVLVAAIGENGMLWGGLGFFLVCPVLGAVVVSGAGRAVFGEPLEPMAALRGLSGVWWRLLVSVLTTRLLVLAAASCFFLPSLLLNVYFGFLVEVMVLEGLHGGEARRRCRGLTTPTYLDLLFRECALLLFMAAATVALFTLVDQLAGLLLGHSLLSGLESRFLGDSLRRLFADPWTMALLTATLWFVYPLARLAWFFSYLDARIRKEGWDLELGFRMEARRIEARV
jgi:hypothetical protein